MLCIINCQYTHNQGKFCQNFQFFHMYTSFSVNLHHFTVTKPKFRSKLPKFRSGKPKFRSECNEISFFEFKNPFRSELPKFSEISPGIPFPPDGGIRSKNEKENPGCRPWILDPAARFPAGAVYLPAAWHRRACPRRPPAAACLVLIRESGEGNADAGQP